MARYLNGATLEALRAGLPPVAPQLQRDGVIQTLRVHRDKIEIDYPQGELLWKKRGGVVSYYDRPAITLTITDPGGAMGREGANYSLWYTDPNHPECRAKLRPHPHVAYEGYICFEEWTRPLRDLLTRRQWAEFVISLGMYLNLYNDTPGHEYIDEWARSRPARNTPRAAPQALVVPTPVAPPPRVARTQPPVHPVGNRPPRRTRGPVREPQVGEIVTQAMLDALLQQPAAPMPPPPPAPVAPPPPVRPLGQLSSWQGRNGRLVIMAIGPDGLPMEIEL
jgi:hypothetical protein